MGAEVKMGDVKRLCNWVWATTCILALASCSATGYSIVDLAPEINATWDRSTVALAVGDTVRVTFPYKPEWNQEARVRPDGTASFLLLDSLTVAGMTAAELDDRLSKLYKDKTTSQSDGLELTVDVPTGGGAGATAGPADGRSVYVVGEVTRPGAVSVAGPLPRPDGVNCARKLEFGANMPWKRVRWARGGGTSAASLAMKSTASHSTCVVPFRHGVLSS